MVKITILYENGLIKGFEASGHAGYAAKGQDIYCAGVSAITGTALIGLQKHLSVPPFYEVKDGWLHCKLAGGVSREDVQKAQLILSTMEAGLISLQDAYPDYIAVIQGGVSDV